MEDGFDPDHPLPLFLADREAKRQASHNAWDRESRVAKASILVAAATATVIAVLAVGNPVTLFAAVKASLVGNSGGQPGTVQPDSTIQSTADAPALIQPTADAQALPPTAKDAPPRDKIAASDPAGEDQAEKSEPEPSSEVLFRHAWAAEQKDSPPRDEIAASETAGKDQAEQSEPSSEVLFRQFQAWVAQQDTQANVKPAQPVQDEAAQVAQNAPAQGAENPSAPHRLVQKRRHVVPVHNARAKMPAQNLRKPVRRAQSARVERPPIQDAQAQRQAVQNAQPQRQAAQNAQAQSQAVQNAQAPSFLKIFGVGN